MNVIKPGPHKVILPVSATEQTRLDHLYRFDGAWTVQEGLNALGPERLREFIAHKYLGVTPTAMGDLLLLLSHGRIATFGGASAAISLNRQLNQAYFRLSLEALGWHLPRAGEPVRKLETYDSTGRFQEVNITYGLALVAGKLTADGFSTEYIRRLATRLRSTALYENFYVIFLTPSAQKGQAHARQHAAFLKVIPVLPQAVTPVEFQLPGMAPGILPPTLPGPYLSGTGLTEHPQFMHLPRLVLNILQRPRDARVEQAMLSIECDGAMSAAQLKGYYGLVPEDLPGIHRVPAIVRTSPTQRTSETAVEFLTFSRRLAKQETHRLGHRCGTGRIRHLAEIPANLNTYKAEHRGRLRTEEPDAVVFEADGREIALEYDNGTYSIPDIESKLSAFRDRGFDEVIWGVSNAPRQRTLTQRFGDQFQREILLAEWWT